MREPVEEVQRAFTAYTIDRELGSGGMATVYLAHDRKHDRKVAIKILHAELAALLGAERFLQEIRLAATLQHPHILGLLDSGLLAVDAGKFQGRPYYVMPYVDGESLRQRLAKERQLPISDSVHIATEVAGALDYAHRHGVVHRDIKPENILLHDGSALVSDFGIALAVTHAGGERMTQSGVSLGTPSYMSPEQAAAERTITGRSDIYSLGAVTYEMLSGEPPFRAPTAQAVVARVMTEEPRPLTSQRRNVPPHVAAAVSRALEKVPADRFASAHEFADALNNPSIMPSSIVALPPRDRPILHAQRVTFGAAALAIVATVAALWGWMRPSTSQRVEEYSLGMDSAEQLAPGDPWAGRLAVSPDGSYLAYVGGPRAQLFIRRRDQLRAIAIPGTDGASSPFFSPDGQHVGFMVASKALEILSLTGGSPKVLVDSLVGAGGASWGPDGLIYADATVNAGLLRIEPKSGAVPRPFTVLDTAQGEFEHNQPAALPNGKGVLFNVEYSPKNRQKGANSFAIAVADIRSGKHRVIVNEAMYPRYASSGHLLYVTTNGTLMIAPFDQNSMKTTGQPTPFIEGMRHGTGGSADLAVSNEGTLVYATGSTQIINELVWVTRDGKSTPVDPDWEGQLEFPALSPDGKWLAITKMRSGQAIADVWVKRLDRGSSLKLTLDENDDYGSTWTPDGKYVTFSSGAAADDLWTKLSDGSARAVLQARNQAGTWDARWSPDGKWLVFATSPGGPGAGDILGMRPGADSAPVRLVATKSTEVAPIISTNGRWLAYTSDESGQFEIYVVPFPNTSAAKWQVSTRGGTEPMWSHRGNELFYRDHSGALVAVEVKTFPTFSLGRATPLFQAAGYATEDWGWQYDVAPDDRRFLMIRPVRGGNSDKLVVVENWLEELKAKSQK